MTREIKFRAWDNITEKMGYSEQLGIGLFFNSHYPKSNLMQFTGLKDKNGVEIYEGDIIQWGYGECKECGQEHKKRKGKVYWSDFGACYQTSSGDYLISNRGNTQLKGNGERDDLEIIGNIYENPELL